MNIKDYAKDVNKEVSEILSLCDTLDIKYEDEESILTEDQIIELDNNLTYDEEEELTEVTEEDLEEEEVEDKAEELAQNTKIDLDNHKKIEKVQKKSVNKENKEKFVKERKKLYKHREKLQSNEVETDDSVIIYKEGMTVKDLAEALDVNVTELIKKLMGLGVMANLNATVDYDTCEVLIADYDKTIKREEQTDISNFENLDIEDKEEDLESRPPVVTIMGHVDHGKTTLLDYIRNSDVVSGEAGGITQAIGAYSIKYKDKKITFIDTPGHAAFTEMRARGAQITDIVIIIVAADDGIMPQTKEAIDHAKAANVPIIVAINKIDKPEANIDRVMTGLVENGLTPEEWGGDIIVNKISAKKGDGVPELLDNILLVSEINDYKANPKRYATGTVIESKKDDKVGSTATLLIQNGTLRLGDPLVVGNFYGKVRTLKNDRGENITEATPSKPVEVTGLSEVPDAGDKFMAFESEKEAKKIAEQRKENDKNASMNHKQAMSLDDLFASIQEGNKEIKVIIKADVNGSAEAVKNSLEKLDVEGVKVTVIRSTVGAITESDIVLANASNAILIGFNVRPNNSIKDYAKEQGVEIRLYDIIYKVVEEMEAAMKGMLDPEYEEQVLGSAEVRQLFKFSKVGIIAGSYVLDGIIKRDAKARVIRDGVVIIDSNVNSLQRGKDAVKEVKKGLECGITVENFIDIKVGDIIEAYEMVEKTR